MKTFAKALLMIALLVPAMARADLDVSMVLTGTYTQPSFTPSQGTVTPSPGLGYGLLFDWPLLRQYRIQFGFASLARKTDLASAQELTAYHFPIQFKSLVTKQFAVGLGAYYELWGATGFETMSYGALASAVLDLPVMPGIGWIVDLRYLYGLRDMDPQASEKGRFSDVVGFTGVRLGFGR